MASKYLQKFPVPTEFPEILHDLTREILREQPEDIILFCAQYFECLKSGKQLNFSNKNKQNAPRQENKGPQNKDSQNKQQQPKYQQQQVQQNQQDNDLASRISSGNSNNTVGIAKRVSQNYTSNLYSNVINRELNLDSNQYDDDIQSHSNQNQDLIESGDLLVNIIGAQDLYVEDEEDIMSLNVYAVIFPSNNPGTMIKTDNVIGTKNPTFNFKGKLVLNVTEEDKQDIQLIIQVYDQSNVKTLLGETQIYLNELFENPDSYFRQALDLQTSHGQQSEGGVIEVSLCWVQSNQQNSQYE